MNFYIKAKSGENWEEPIINQEYDNYSDEQLTEIGFHKFNPTNNPQPSPKYNSSYSYELDTSKNTVNMVWEHNLKTGTDLSRVISLEWNNVRNIRNIMLNESDWTQMSDNDLSNESKSEWANYRKLLRDITASTTDPFEIIYPRDPLGLAYDNKFGVSRV